MRILSQLLCAALLASASPLLAQTGNPPRPLPPPAQRIVHEVPDGTADGAKAGINQPVAVYSHGNPTAEEQYILELINRARANPKAEGDTLFATRDPDITAAFDYWGTPTRAQVRSDFATYTAKPPLAFNADLIAATRKHSQDMLDHNFQSHTGSDGSTFDQRINNAGYTGWSNAGENIYAYGTSMFDIHASFQIDFGNPELGHRQNIMNFSTDSYREIGIGVLHGGSGLPNVGPIVTTEDFGRKANTFVVGVVYDDKNKNGFYDIGEGLSGITITVSGGSYSAVTSTSGGYAVPYSGSGTVTVSAKGTGLPGTLTKNVTFAGENVKVDFTPLSTGAPGAVTLVLPAANAVLHAESTKLTWNKIFGATNYHIQFGLDTVVANMLLNDTTLSDSTKTVNNIVDGATYYWRVRAKNSKGWGPFSDFATFVVALPAKKVTLVTPAAGASVNTVQLSWNTSTPNVTKYRVQVYPNGSLINPIVNDSTITDTTYAFSAGLVPNTTYYWRVAAFNGLGWGSPSDVRTFTYTGLGVTSSNSKTFGLMTASRQDGIRFTVTGSPIVSPRLEIFSVTGVRVLDQRLSESDLQWNASAGVYLYRASDGSSTITGRVIIP